MTIESPYAKCYSRGTYTWDIVTDKLKFEFRCGNTLAYFTLDYAYGKNLIHEVDSLHLFPDYESIVILGMQKESHEFIWDGFVYDPTSDVPEAFKWLSNLVNVDMIFYEMMDYMVKLQEVLQEKLYKEEDMCSQCFVPDGKHNRHCVHYPFLRETKLWVGNPQQLLKVIKPVPTIPKAKRWTRSVFSV